MATQAKAQRAFARRVNTVQQRQTVLTSSQQAELAATAQAYPQALARLRKGAPALPALYGSAAAGNSGAVTSDQRGQDAAQPGKGPGAPEANTSPYPARLIITPDSQLGLRARTPGYQHGAMTARDRRVAGNRGTITLSGAPDSKPGFPDPDADGPARPGWQQINRTLSHQIGTDATAFLDNPDPKPMTSAGRRAFALGTRGDPWTVIWGGTRGLANYRPYGYRGFPAGAGPSPKVVALPGGPGGRPGTVLAAGDPSDGPQKLASGPPWGLHSRTVPPVTLTQGSLRPRFTQVRPPRLNRPLNSAAAGQSFDQAVVHADGSVAVKIPRLAPGRQPGLQRRRTR